MDGFDFFPDFDLVPSLIPIEPTPNYQEVCIVQDKGYVLPHYQAIRDIFYRTSGTRAHLANMEHVQRMTTVQGSVDICAMRIDMELWRRCSNMTLWVMNALFSLTTLVTKPSNFLYDPARNLKRVACLGTRPEKCMTSAHVTVVHDDDTVSNYEGTMPCGLFLAAMGMYTMATTTLDKTNIWGRTERPIASKLHAHASNACVNITVSQPLEPSDMMLPVEIMVLLSKRVRTFALNMAAMVRSPEALADTSSVTSNCPACRRKVSTATPRHKLSPTHEEYDPNEGDLIGEQRLLRVKITDGDSFQVYRHIYICKDCNDDTRPLRFNHLSIAPTRSRKRKVTTGPRINVDTIKTLETVDYLANTFLPPSKRQKFLTLSSQLREKIV